LFGRDILKAGTGYLTYRQEPIGYGGQVENQIGLQIHYTYGNDDSPALAGISNKRKQQTAYKTRTVDPVTTGIIGFSAGAIYVQPDNDWGLRGGYGEQWSLGLYFTKSVSTRLNYSTAQLTDKATGESVKYENYGLDTQYYFNHNRQLRPFITGGFGETIYDESDDSKTFQINAGLGLHYTINSNWAVQTDWRHVYTPELKTAENQFSSSLLYRFSTGETSR
ncbi:MAG: outer membrane beta-barrel protein, partial [Psychromonas sp.]